MEQKTDKKGLKVEQKEDTISIYFDGRYVARISMARYNSGKMFGRVAVWDVKSKHNLKTRDGIKGIMMELEQT